MDELIRLIEAGADAIQIGDPRFGMRLSGHFPVEELGQAVKAAHERGARVYVVCNNIMDNAILPQLPDYLKQVQEAGADAIVFGDPAVLIAMKQAGVSLPLHWNAEMTSTNYVTANYWGTKGAVRVVLARELNMDQVLEFKNNAKLEVQVQVHGMTNIYHSKRALVSNYFVHQGQDPTDANLSQDRKLFLIEEERQDERFPVYEDRNGTHIMSSDDVCMVENMQELLEAGIDSFKIEGLLKPIEYTETVVRCYRATIDAYMADPEGFEFDEEQWLEPIRALQHPERELSFGFFYKEQVY
ncbi:peptidase U32 family protein [Paenibacillus koleovorans]|uniref:peptidase U32 family protein n=1 Tax=Paenibacillus koleovorans TaxID=121608 RepID=UPI000FDAB938|nr:peptidase U32 family protein [Paenibacillus koleovorans]